MDLGGVGLMRASGAEMESLGWWSYRTWVRKRETVVLYIV